MRAPQWGPRRAHTLLLLLAGMSTALVGCGGDDDDPPATESRPATTATETTPPTNRRKALEKFIRLSYELAVAEADESGQFSEEGKDLLRDADQAWQEYAAADRLPKAALARMMVRAYGPSGLNKPADAATAAEIVALADPTAQAYVELVRYAANAAQTRKADLAGRKALELARPDERDTVRALIEQAKVAAAP